MTKASYKGFTLTLGNTDDRQPVAKLLQQIFGKVFAGNGYVSQKLAKRLLEAAGVQLITKLRCNMKNRLMLLSERLLLRKPTSPTSTIESTSLARFRSL